MPSGWMKKYDGVGAGQKKIRFKKVKVVCGNISMDFIQKVDKTNKKSENHYGLHSIKRRKRNKFRRRNGMKKQVKILQKEEKDNMIEMKFKKAKIQKKHQKELRILRQKFFKDIYELWEKHANEMKEFNVL